MLGICFEVNFHCILETAVTALHSQPTSAAHCAFLSYFSTPFRLVFFCACLRACVLGCFCSCFCSGDVCRRDDDKTLTPEEKLERSRVRNRDHSRKSRQRKKALVEGMKKQVGGGGAMNDDELIRSS